MAKKDKVLPLKVENSIDGTESDFLPTELNPDEDYISAKGITFENSDDQIIHITDNEITFEDTINGIRKFSSISSEVLRSNHQTFTYTLGNVSNYTCWVNSEQTQKIRENNYTYSSGKVLTDQLKIYDVNGNLLFTYTETYTYSGINILSISGVLT